ncbi:MAG: hypothetical protein K6A90_00960 [Lachnospiraceae bacterium]|nr:hypothetical protein [Lachnospiraceae bacterium]
MTESARADTWINHAADQYTGGSGTEDDPYLISSPEEMAYLAKEVNSGETYSQKYFKLTQDIDLAGHDWVPAGMFNYTYNSQGFTSVTYNVFRGILDGDFHCIKNMYAFCNNNNAGFAYSGLFGIIGQPVNPSQDYVCIKNLGIEGTVNASADIVAYCGGLAGLIEGRLMDNPATYIRINRDLDVTDTGIDKKLIIRNCYFKGTVNARSNNGAYVGGIGGYCDNCTIKNSFYDGAGITSTNRSGSRIGGIIGYSKALCFIQECYSRGLTGENENISSIIYGGKDYSITCNNNFYLIKNEYSDGNKYNILPETQAKGLTEAEFKKRNSFTNWDFVNTWEMGPVSPLLTGFDNPPPENEDDQGNGSSPGKEEDQGNGSSSEEIPEGKNIGITLPGLNPDGSDCTVKLFYPQKTVSYNFMEHVSADTSVPEKQKKKRCADLDISVSGLPALVSAEYVYKNNKKASKDKAYYYIKLKYDKNSVSLNALSKENRKAFKKAVKKANKILKKKDNRIHFDIEKLNLADFEYSKEKSSDSEDIFVRKDGSGDRLVLKKKIKKDNANKETISYKSLSAGINGVKFTVPGGEYKKSPTNTGITLKGNDKNITGEVTGN